MRRGRRRIFRAHTKKYARSIDSSPRARRRARRRVSRRARTGDAREMSRPHAGGGLLGILGREVWTQVSCLVCMHSIGVVSVWWWWWWTNTYGVYFDLYTISVLVHREVGSRREASRSRRTPFIHSRVVAFVRRSTRRRRTRARERTRSVVSRPSSSRADRHGVASRRGIDRVARTTTARSHRGRGATPWRRARGRGGRRDVDARGDERWRAKERTR